jgi:hypothetical protein
VEPDFERPLREARRIVNNVVIHQDAIDKLLAGPEITRFVEGKAREITESVQKEVVGYFTGEDHYAPDLAYDVADDVDFTMDGSSAVIGIRDKGSKSRRLVDKGLMEKWLLRAKEAARE